MTLHHGMEVTTVRLPLGSEARMNAVMSEREKHSDFVRRAVANELKRREEARGASCRPS